MLSTKGHYGSLNRQLTQSRLLEPESAANWGVAWQGEVAMGWQVEGTGVDMKQGFHGPWARLAEGCGGGAALGQTWPPWGRRAVRRGTQYPCLALRCGW